MISRPSMSDNEASADSFEMFAEMSAPKVNTNEGSRITTEQNYYLLVTCQGIFATSFGLTMTVAPSMFNFIATKGSYDDHTEDSIRYRKSIVQYS
jgi:hypothetical protein